MKIYLSIEFYSFAIIIKEDSSGVAYRKIKQNVSVVEFINLLKHESYHIEHSSRRDFEYSYDHLITIGNES